MKKLKNHLNNLNIKFGHAFEGIYINRNYMDFDLKQKIESLKLRVYELDTLIVIY